MQAGEHLDYTYWENNCQVYVFIKEEDWDYRRYVKVEIETLGSLKNRQKKQKRQNKQKKSKKQNKSNDNIISEINNDDNYPFYGQNNNSEQSVWVVENVASNIEELVPQLEPEYLD